MEPQISSKSKELGNCNDTLVPSVILNSTAAIINLCNSDSFGMIASNHELISANSIELNAATSLSDDSGVPLTTNSSISSGDSYRLGICKFEMELAESDGEVSQFDSLDNCSEGGMSAENFNTLKKVPLAPIDPPPEFQDSPHTTLTRSLSKNVLNNIPRWSSQSSLQIVNDITTTDKPTPNIIVELNPIIAHVESSLKDSYSKQQHIYSSDSILNSSNMDNIYDEPNDILSSSVGNSIDVVDQHKMALCPHFQDHTRYFRAIPSEQDVATHTHQMQLQRFNLTGLSDIHDYDLYYGLKRSAYQDGSLQRRLLYSPLHHHHYQHQYHYHSGGSGNRPNSRNSLNSRLSSSHNSLSVSNANKPDDSIFITQAMSHDALLTREISDFYNVPIDSDIYAFPIDMIKPPDAKDTIISKYKDSMKSNQKNRLKYSRNNKRRKRNNNNNINNLNNNNTSTDDNISGIDKFEIDKSKTKANKNAEDKRHSVPENPIEPLHMTLDEVKQFYHTLYSDAKDLPMRNNTTSSLAHKSTISSKTPTHSITLNRSSNGVCGGGEGGNISGTIITPRPNKHSTLKQVSINHTKSTSNSAANIKNANKFVVGTVGGGGGGGGDKNNDVSNNNNINNINNNHINKITTIQTEKKSQFTLNLKQKFCSIFRFRKSHNRCRANSTDSAEYISSNKDQSTTTNQQSESADDKRRKFQSRALPPLPKKAEFDTLTAGVETQENLSDVEDKDRKKTELRSFHFTSSIEKVKDYGWYWGPLSSEAAEKVLSNEPDGSFIVRDSSDDHYIFSLSFKLNNCVRHVRIEQDQGTFSFGSYAKFKSQTITEFIEKAVEHSRSGRYLFFLHRRPEHGPMRVQLTNPVSRFKHIQSLQHMCRFVILKAVVRKDLLQTLPLPRRLLDYLNYKHCYSEQVESDSSQSQMSGDGQV